MLSKNLFRGEILQFIMDYTCHIIFLVTTPSEILNKNCLRTILRNISSKTLAFLLNHIITHYFYFD